MQKKSFSLVAFTLVELMVAITIMGILMFASYIPYEHHQKKVALRLAAKEISQSLSEARNLAIYGLDTGSGNVGVWLVFSSGSKDITYYAYPYTETPLLTNLKQEYKFKTKKLPPGISVETVNWVSDDFLFFFEAISGSWNITQNIPIQISYAGSDNSVLQKEITYYYKSHISDYQ